ncbi:MAG: hypothetical protein IPH62_00275 [Ignavibacteriae bacterium]|nr:hypothetical protein [Ignavibacteriota bacterium]
MKIKSYLLSIFLIYILSPVKYSGQSEFNISSGIGYSELLNIGLYYQYYQTQLGITVGSWPNENIFTISSDVRFHLGEISELSKRRCWYIMYGINYLKYETNRKIGKYQFALLRIGREINITSKIGFDLNIGTMVEINKNIKNKMEEFGPQGDVDSLFPINFGFRIFYRI